MVAIYYFLSFGWVVVLLGVNADKEPPCMIPSSVMRPHHSGYLSGAIWLIAIAELLTVKQPCGNR